jgi:hypothetical protein
MSPNSPRFGAKTRKSKLSFTSTIRNTETAPAAVEAITASPAPKSQLVTNDPKRVELVKDAKGRMIGARMISAIDMFELTLVLGEHSSNSAALNQALMAASVVSIDGRDVARPLSMVALKARIMELGFEGYTAAAEATARFAGPDVSDAAVRDAVKN